MGKDLEDIRFLEVMRQSLERLEGSESGGDTARWRQSALELLRSAEQGLHELVEREDLEEQEAEEALQALKVTRRELDLEFFRVITALDVRLGELRISGEMEPEELIALGQFLNRYHDGSFRGLRSAAAISQAQRAYELAVHYRVPGDEVERISERVEYMRAALSSTTKEGAEAIEAYGELVEGRSMARVCYMTARDLVSASLRFEGEHERLDWYIPSLGDIFMVGFNVQ